MSKDTPEVSYKDTLNLPQTDFPIRPNHAASDSELLKRWEENDLAGRAMVHNDGAPNFILHDGPPYANGHIHLGHAYNKILKDILTKSQRMEGKHVPVIPGWDCHGLPIEYKVAAENPGLSGKDLIAACRKYAQEWIATQKKEFIELGVLMDWKHPYLTMSPEYEAGIVRAFGRFISQGYIEKKNKTVPWCANCITVLATAEIEYEERKDPSIYVLFPLISQNIQGLEGKVVNLLVWTTTPWTLPLNRAVVLKPGTTYAVLKDGDINFIVAECLVDKICAQKEIEKHILALVKSEQLVGKLVQHPFISELSVPVLLDGFVSLEDGTACVHCAPGCGPEDYELGIKNNLEIFSPVSPDGKYTSEIQPGALVGMTTTDGQVWVLKALAENGNLYYKTSIRHSYPHCWRCHQGLIFRATSQWFCNLAQDSLKERTLKALNGIEFIPARSKNSLESTIGGRLEWCLSRQRTWGVPIIAALCKECGQHYVTPELIEKVAAGIEQRGIEYWWEVSLAELLPDGLRCNSCQSSSFVKEHDILDVWFDAGLSHLLVLFNNPEQAYPADAYLEGRDQARGWFQSSLLTSMVLEKKAPMKLIATHGYTVDAKGRKMSKSLGNVVAPQDLIKELGTDGLRLWAASNDFASDPIASQELLKNVGEVYRKIRNTLRFLMSNLADFDFDNDKVDLLDLNLIDQYALCRLQEVSFKVRQNYASCKFTTVFHTLADYCATDLSAVYLDIVKDRLYVSPKRGRARRAAQTVCWYILDTLNKLTAPIMSFTAEQVSDHYERNKQNSVHLQKFADIFSVWQRLVDSLQLSDNQELQAWTNFWDRIFTLRDHLLKAIEGPRASGLIKHSLEASLSISLGGDLLSDLEHYLQLNRSGQRANEFLKELIIVSNIYLKQSSDIEKDQVQIEVNRADGKKCQRCWKYDSNKNEYLCGDCELIV